MRIFTETIKGVEFRYQTVDGSGGVIVWVCFVNHSMFSGRGWTKLCVVRNWAHREMEQVKLR